MEDQLVVCSALDNANMYIETIEAENQPLVKRARENLARASQIVVTDRESAELAGMFVAQCKGLAGEFEELYDDDIAKAFSLHRSLTSKRKAFVAPLKSAAKTVAQLVTDWRQEEKRIADALAEKIAAEAAEIERKRVEDELQAQALADAAKFEDEGDVEAATERFEQAEQIIVPAVPVAPVDPSSRPMPAPIAGVRDRTTYTMTIEDTTVFLRWILAGATPLKFKDFLSVNVQAMNREGTRRAKAGEDALPGCTITKHVTGA